MQRKNKALANAGFVVTLCVMALFMYSVLTISSRTGFIVTDETIYLVLTVAGIAILAWGIWGSWNWDRYNDFGPYEQEMGERLYPFHRYAFTIPVIGPWKVITRPFIYFWEWGGIFGLIPMALYAPFFLFGALFTFLWTAFFSIYNSILWAVGKAVIAVSRNRDRSKWRKHVGHVICPQCGIKLGKGERAKKEKVEKFKRQWYVCGCGRVHKTLSPDKFGISHRLCKCNRNLLRVNFKDGERARYDMKCPICEANIHTNEAMPFSISLVGGSGSGKSSLLYNTMAKFGDAGEDMTVEYYDNEIQSKVNDARGGRVTPTRQGFNKPSVMFFRRPDYKRDKAIYYFDISGEEFTPESTKSLLEEQYLWNDGIIFVISPDSMRGFMNKIGMATNKDTPETIFEAFYQKYSEYLDLHPKETSNAKVAVVLSHAKDPRFKEQMTPFDFNNVANDAAVKEHSVRTKEFLIEMDELNFVNTLESRFKNVCYFTVDAGDDSVIAPTLWIMSERYPRVSRYFQVH